LPAGIDQDHNFQTLSIPIPFDLREIERANAYQLAGALQNLGVAEAANRIGIAALPVLHHGTARKLEILGDALGVVRVIDEVHDIADLVVSLLLQHFHVFLLAQLGRKLLDEIGDRKPELLCLFVLIGRGPGAAGELDFLLPQVSFKSRGIVP
jgi:hypothetical protein